MWSSNHKQQRQKVEAWLSWTFGLLERRNKILSSKRPADQLNELAELSKERVRQKELLPPLTDVFLAEGDLVWADRIEDLSIVLADYSCFSHAKEFGLAMLDLVEGVDFEVLAGRKQIDPQVEDRVSETMRMITQGKKEFYDELAQSVEDKLHAYLRDKGLPRSAPLPTEITLQIMNEVNDELLERVSEETLQEIEGIYDKVWENIKAIRSRAFTRIASVANEYRINPKRFGLD